MRGHAHDDDVGGVGGLGEVGGGAQGLAQDDVVAEVAVVAVIVVDVLGGGLERTHCSVGPRRAQIDATVVPQEPPPRTTTWGSRFSAAMAISVLPKPQI